jgi:hypothetical protein
MKKVPHSVLPLALASVAFAAGQPSRDGNEIAIVRSNETTFGGRPPLKVAFLEQ